MRRPRPVRPDRRIGRLLALTGAIGWLASFQLTVDDWRLLKDPAYRPPCDISPIVSCGSVMSSPEGSVFGFPNMLLGLGAFAAIAGLGLAVLGGARLHRALWLALNTGALAGVVFVHWLIYQSLFVLGRLCPYCAVVWAVTIALFWYVTLRNLRHGVIPLPAAGRSVLALVLETHWILLAAWYGVIAVLALTQFREYGSSLLP
ncbi:vitamin K epoxide reductase family protein [Streptomyces malaysiensis]|uniref:Vitamin K epoxide reductase family protein n=1 Tax=Streptomyces malaysiensis subsp. samsunensis TaxID=459658 RepID=A0A9X2LS20_STRMQ|nr:vitamin K epoxide reductase family protein [Streptomyces samsunensis]MCQ8828396.1 vitamin K epoxide reductase family protein [Streptomyces samsunensis]